MVMSITVCHVRSGLVCDVVVCSLFLQTVSQLNIHRLIICMSTYMNTSLRSIPTADVPVSGVVTSVATDVITTGCATRLC